MRASSKMVEDGMEKVQGENKRGRRRKRLLVHGIVNLVVQRLSVEVSGKAQKYLRIGDREFLCRTNMTSSR